MYLAVVNTSPSHVKGKRYTVTLNNGKKYNVGLDTGQTYIGHHDWTKRTNYRRRHYASPKEKPLLESLTPPPAVLSYYLLWGLHRDLQENIKYLNRLWTVRKTQQ